MLNTGAGCVRRTRREPVFALRTEEPFRSTPGDGATAPATAGAPVWQVQVTLREGGPFTNLRASPSIDVRASDGSSTPR
jgi:hypothetical protein